MSDLERGEKWKDGGRAVAHIWISAILERCAKIRGTLKEALRTKRALTPPELDDMKRLCNDIARCWKGLGEAAQTNKEDEAGQHYLKIIAGLYRELKPPVEGTAIPRTDKIPGMADALQRHLRNAWLHSHETVCWLALFGLAKGRLADLPIGSPPMSDIEALPKYRTEQVSLLYKWTGDPNSVKSNMAVSLAGLIRAAGGYEYIGELLLLARNCEADPETKQALEWYIQNELPSIGCNDLCQASL